MALKFRALKLEGFRASKLYRCLMFQDFKFLKIPILYMYDCSSWKFIAYLDRCFSKVCRMFSDSQRHVF